jgi:chromatin segregation and condensation protein Rec8/ScpA/Scc1 (kleisin family)
MTSGMLTPQQKPVLLVSKRRARLRVLISALMIGALVSFVVEPAVAGTTKSKNSATKSSKTSKSSSKSSKSKPRLASLSEKRAKQAKVRKQRATAAANVKRLKNETKEVERDLAALTGDVKDWNAQYSSAKRALADAEQELEAASLEVAETQDAIAQMAGTRQAAALDAYTKPRARRLNTVFSSSGLAEASQQRVYLDAGNRERADAVDRLVELEEDRRIALSRATKAEKRREANKKAAAKRLASLKAAQVKAASYADLVDDRLETALYERASLEGIDDELAKQIAKETAELERQVAAARRNGAGKAGGGSGSGTRLPDIPTGSTNGIVVAKSIQGKLAALLRHAASDGIVLRGGGYRNPAQQIAVRRRNCGSSSYAVYQMPSSSCRPPTAKPGRSQHERGLAIDFTQNGRALNRGSSGYRWLRQHAHKYGFFNLPSEPWHWSTTGR